VSSLMFTRGDSVVPSTIIFSSGVCLVS
jgi:hypothetical protein